MSLKNVQFSVASHVMAALAIDPDVSITSAVLARSVNADPSFVRRVLAKLSRAGLISTSRGKHGACELAKAPNKISMLDIYRASEAPAAFSIHDYPIERSCDISCNMKEVMEEVLEKSQSDFERSLSKQTLADIVTSIKKKL